ncbi:hypothetical protein CROQUDRAFT_97908 [Cronartium quercuum f. sp. fusiforme G11]|uniref:Uncharacterized protein n=1 Tax=Cronartium quercuum f. sp. fusiforme G11 TaxID=708437 RepID=A0A9P6N9J7_9BASI|nr:hypothetical protein CROQUDRAFT_97908 [Cronartium quercuum f. sp. fusiforme G11]
MSPGCHDCDTATSKGLNPERRDFHLIIVEVHSRSGCRSSAADILYTSLPRGYDTRSRPFRALEDSKKYSSVYKPDPNQVYFYNTWCLPTKLDTAGRGRNGRDAAAKIPIQTRLSGSEDPKRTCEGGHVRSGRLYLSRVFALTLPDFSLAHVL